MQQQQLLRLYLLLRPARVVQVWCGVSGNRVRSSVHITASGVEVQRGGGVRESECARHVCAHAQRRSHAARRPARLGHTRGQHVPR